LITPPLGSKLCQAQIVDRANLPIETLTALKRELPRLGTLRESVLWGSAERPPVLLTETIALDEYSTRSHSSDVHLAYMRHMPHFICGIWSLRIKFNHSPGLAAG
jgi:hypothetical protein